MAERRYNKARWAALKQGILARQVSLSDEQRRCVECEVQSLEEWVKRHRQSQVAR